MSGLIDPVFNSKFRRQPGGYRLEGDDLDSVPRSKKEKDEDPEHFSRRDDREDEPPIKNSLEEDLDMKGDDREEEPRPKP